MLDFTKSVAGGTIAILPAASALGIYLSDIMNPYVVSGFVLLNTIWLMMFMGQISRFFVNKQ